MITDSLSYIAKRAKYKRNSRQNGYSQILDIKHSSQAAFDSSKRKTTSDLGMNIARNRNPHYKN